MRLCGNPKQAKQAKGEKGEKREEKSWREEVFRRSPEAGCPPPGGEQSDSNTFRRKAEHTGKFSECFEELPPASHAPANSSGSDTSEASQSDEVTL